MNLPFRLTILQAITTVCLLAQTSVTQSRYDRFPTAANTRETTLTASNVNAASFGKLYSYYVDGAVYAQPLYLPSVQIPGRGARNVLYVATMNDKLYAFDADQAGPPLWLRDFTDETAGVTPVLVVDITNDNALNIVGNVGIEGTPVIDPAAGSIYLVVRTKEQGKYFQRLHKLDLTTGKDQIPPATIEAAVPSTARDATDGQLHFDPKAGNQRPALVLVNGQVVIAWASHEDFPPYHGWIMTYDGATLKQTGAVSTTPNSDAGGIWQSGRGPAVDSSGNAYFAVGNGGWNGKTDFGSSILKLQIGAADLAVVDSFTPHDYGAINEQDADIGSTGPLVIPGTSILICGSKRGIIYVLDTGKMGRMTANDEGLLQTLEVNGGRVMAGPAYWDGPSGPTLFIWCETDFPKAFRFKGRLFDPMPVLKGTVASHASPGGAITISSDGKRPGTGILWGTVTTGKSADHGNQPGVFHAFNAETLREIWNSEQRPERDRLGTLVKFVPPLVVAGKVYIPNYDNGVNVYGLLPSGSRP